MLILECVEGLQEWIGELELETARMERTAYAGGGIDLSRYAQLISCQQHMVAALAVASVIEAQIRDERKVAT